MNNFSFFLFFLVIFHFSQSLIQADDEEKFVIRWKYKVHIINGYANNDNPLIIHCKSRDDDLGEHTLWMNNEFLFKFRKDFFVTTAFWCGFIHGSSRKVIYVFRIDYESNFCRATGNCFWSVREDGFYFSNDNKSWVKRYNW